MMQSSVAMNGYIGPLLQEEMSLDDNITSLAQTLIEGTGARLGVLDLLGVDLEPGPHSGLGLYGELMRRMARSFKACFN